MASRRKWKFSAIAAHHGRRDHPHGDIDLVAQRIADALHLSVKTVSTHKGRILEQLQRPNLAALVRYGLQQGLVDAAVGDAGLQQAEP